MSAGSYYATGTSCSGDDWGVPPNYKPWTKITSSGAEDVEMKSPPEDLETVYASEEEWSPSRATSVTEGETTTMSHKTALQCMVCQNSGMPSGMLICLPEKSVDHDWQGTLPLICWSCQQEEQEKEGYTGEKIKDEAAFKALTKKMWKKRKTLQKGHANRARGTTWKHAVADVGERYSGETQRMFRRRVLHGMASMAALLYRGFSKATPEDFQVMTSAVEEWVEERDKMAKNPTYHAAVGGFFLSDDVDQYLSQICEGLDEYFICRKEESRPYFFGARCMPAGGGGGGSSFFHISSGLTGYLSLSGVHELMALF